MNKAELKSYKLERLEERLASLDKNTVVKVRISYLISVMEVLDNDLYKRSYKKLCDLLLNKVNKIELLKKLGNSRIEMTAGEAAYLLKRTIKLNIDKSMLVVVDNSKIKRK